MILTWYLYKHSGCFTCQSDALIVNKSCDGVQIFCCQTGGLATPDSTFHYIRNSYVYKETKCIFNSFTNFFFKYWNRMRKRHRAVIGNQKNNSLWGCTCGKSHNFAIEFFVYSKQKVFFLMRRNENSFLGKINIIHVQLWSYRINSSVHKRERLMTVIVGKMAYRTKWGG